MASNPLDSFDEFFDFAQLESDNGLHVDSQQHLHEQTISTLAIDSAMDWQPSTPNDNGPFAGSTVGYPSYDGSITLSYDSATLDPVSLYESTGSLQPQPCLRDSIAGGSSATFPCSINSHEAAYQIPQDALSSQPVAALPSPAANNIELRARGISTPAQPHRSGTITRKPASAKRKGPSTRIPLEAKQMLEEEFAANPYPCSWEIDIIAHQANLDVKRVRNWYNNTRARKKPSGDFLHP